MSNKTRNDKQNNNQSSTLKGNQNSTNRNQNNNENSNQNSNQSRNQSRNHNSNQSTNQGRNHSSNQSTNQSRNQSTNQKNNRNTYKNTNVHSAQPSKPVNWFLLLPLIIALTVIPLIVRTKEYDPNFMQFQWFPNVDLQTDIFLYFKHWIFVGIATIMVMMIAIKAYLNKKSLRFLPIFIPLAAYGLLAFLSAIFSNNASFSFQGSMDQFESVFAILGYCVVVYYAFLFINTEKEIQFIIRFFLISILLLCGLGLTQFLGHDFFATELGKKMITSKDYWNSLDTFVFNFEANRVYLTLFNPNYVGVYVALVAPFILTLLLFSKKLMNSVLYLLALIGLIICAIGSSSLAGFIGLGVSVFGVLVFLWRHLFKRYYIFIPVGIIIIITLFVLIKHNDNLMINRIRNITHIEKTEKNLTDITTNDDSVSFTYKGNVMDVVLNVDDITSAYFIVKDQNGTAINNTYDDTTNTFIVQDERFPGFSISALMHNELLSFCVTIDGYPWYFTNQVEDGTYYYQNVYGKLDKIVKAPSAVFTGYEAIASGRGYLWSRTIPLIRNHIILGSGPDTFVMTFPQQDYVGIYNNNYASQIISKPHSLYLQIAVQTGLLSLIAFLVFYAMYFGSSMLLYIRGRFNSYYAQVGIAIFIGTISYMICGLTNDSSITTAPVFWALIGIGIVANYKAKPLILEENASIKEKNQEKKQINKAKKEENIN